MWAAIATWPFGLQAVTAAGDLLSAGRCALDAAESGVRLVEADPAVDSVGLGGFLNEIGQLELDAAVMDGDTLHTGAVAGVTGFAHPVTIARAVMEHTRHNILVGPGAASFARKMGIPEAGQDALITPAARKAWAERATLGHDTVGCITLDSRGSMAAATSTSGASGKTPGRVGDSPLIGSGFYADSTIGAAAATGWGEDIMRTCCSFRAVSLMDAGMAPQEAAETVVRTAHSAIVRHGGTPDCIALVCMNRAGAWGAAANHPGFACAVSVQGSVPRVFPVEPVSL